MAFMLPFEVDLTAKPETNVWRRTYIPVGEDVSKFKKVGDFTDKELEVIKNTPFLASRIEAASQMLTPIGWNDVYKGKKVNRSFTDARQAYNFAVNNPLEFLKSELPAYLATNDPSAATAIVKELSNAGLSTKELNTLYENSLPEASKYTETSYEYVNRMAQKRGGGGPLGFVHDFLVPIASTAGALVGGPVGAAIGNSIAQLAKTGKVDPVQVAIAAGATYIGQELTGGAEAAGGTGEVASVGGTPGVSEVFPVTPPAPIQVAPLPPQAAGAGLGGLANAPGSGMAVQVGPNSTPIPGAGGLKEIYPELGVVSKFGEGATLVPGSAAEALALSTGATLTPVVAPVASGAPIIDKSFPAPKTPETFEPSSIIDTAGEVLGGLTGAEIAGGLLVGGALMGGAPEPEIPAEPAPKVYDPRGFDVKLDRGTAIDVAGTPIPVINFSRTTPVEQGGLPSGTRPAGDFLPLLSFDASAAPTAQGQDMRSVNLPAPDTSFFIDPVTGQITVAPTQTEGGELAPAPTPMREGGLAAAAKQVANAGRGGDTMLAHITPEEAGVLKALGGAGTINPRTGLPEFLKIGGIDLNPRRGIKLNLGPLGNVKVGRKSSDLLLAAGAGYAGAAGIGGLTPATAGLYYGGFRGLVSGNLMEGLQAGLSAYGMGRGFEAFGVQPGAPGAAGGAGGVGGGGGVASEAGGVTSANAPVGADFVEEAYGPFGGETVPATVSTAPTRLPITTPEQFTAASQAAEATRAGFPLSSPEMGGIADLSAPFEVQAISSQNAAAAAPTGFLARNLPAGVQEYVPDFLLDASGTTLAAGTILGSSLLSGQQERQEFERQQAEAERKRRERLGIYENLAQRTLGGIRMARSGGLMSLAGGGMTYMEAGGTTGPTGVPRDVTGTGDGMSDSVPATIEGVQEARLADGEFVIPADVVADIGNGSSDAGSKKLYDMMDRIRKARHGTTKQPPEINAEALMPA